MAAPRTGWTLGAGVEYAITNNITIKGEYLYFNLGSRNSSTDRKPAAINFIQRRGGGHPYATAKINYNASIFRAGVNYKF